MARCLAFKISQRGVLRDVEVAGHERRGAGQRLLEDRPCLLDAQFNGGNALAVATPRERSLASRAQIAHPVDRPKRRDQQAIRSEEHTSELQSRQYLVCRLLLE